MFEFVFQNDTKIYFGENQLSHLSEEIKKYGSKVLLCYGGSSIKRNGIYSKVMEELKTNGVEVFELSGIEPNPRHTTVNKGAEICKREKIDVVLAVGGGSTIDCAKTIAAACYYDGDSWDLVVHKAEITKALPIITIVTLSATGSEMNKAAVISNIDIHEKHGHFSPFMAPKVSFLDPKNTYTVPAYQTASGSADIVAHILEKFYFSDQPKLQMMDDIMEAVIKNVVKYAPIAIKQPDSYEARANLMWASSWALNDFLRNGVTQILPCHAIEHQLSAFYDITHGHGLAIIIPRWLKYALSDKTAPQIYRLGRNVFKVESGLDEMEGAEKSIEALSNFFYNDLGLSSTLSSLGIDDRDFKAMADNACGKNGIKGFINLSSEDVINIYKMCL